MTPVEEQLKATLARVASEVPEAHELGDRAVTKARRRRKWTAAISGALAAGIAAAVVIAVALLAPFSSPEHVASPAASPAPSNNWLNLTGKELGDALGLQPIRGSVSGCYVVAEFENNVGYCLDGVIGGLTHAQVRQLARQVNGYLTVPDLVGMQFDEAVATITRAGFVAGGTLSDHGDTVEAQDPAPGDEAKPQSVVTLTLSPTTGPPDPLLSRLHCPRDMPHMGGGVYDYGADATGTDRWRDAVQGILDMDYQDRHLSADAFRTVEHGDTWRIVGTKEHGDWVLLMYVSNTHENGWLVGHLADCS